MNNLYTTYINQLLDYKCTLNSYIHLNLRLLITTEKYKYNHDFEYITYNLTIYFLNYLVANSLHIPNILFASDII